MERDPNEVEEQQVKEPSKDQEEYDRKQAELEEERRVHRERREGTASER